MKRFSYASLKPLAGTKETAWFAEANLGTKMSHQPAQVGQLAINNTDSTNGGNNYGVYFKWSD